MEKLYRFGDYRVDVAARRVDRRGEALALEPRPFDLLVHLIRERRRVVPREELLEQLWPQRTASHAALARSVMKLRQAICAPDGAEIIRTVSRVGYRFVAPLSEDMASGATAATDSPTIALLPVENASGDASLAWLELGLMALAARDLEGHPPVVPAAVASVLAALQGARAAGDTSIDAAVCRATGAGIVVHSRIVRGRGAELRLSYAARGGASFRGSVASDRPTELAARFADALVLALHPAAAQPRPRERHDPLADEAYARGVQALTAHDWAKAANLLRLALDLEPDRLDAQLALLRALGNVGDTGMLPLAQRLLARAGREQDSMLAARVHQSLGLLYLNRSDLAPADHHLGLALECAAGQGGPHWTAGTLLLQASAAGERLDYAGARRILGLMYEQCELSGDRMLPVVGLGLEANATASGGDLEQAVVLSIEATRRARAFRMSGHVVACCDNTALYLAKLGRLAEAAAQAEESVAAALSVQGWADAWRSMPTLCWIYRLARAPQAARRAIERLPDPADVPCPEYVWRSRALLAAAEGRHAEAADGLLRAMRRHRELEHGYDEAHALPPLVDALVLSGRLAEAEAELEAATAPHLSGSADLMFQVLHARALLAHARGHLEETRTSLARLADSAAAPLWRAWACIDLAWLDAEAGRTEAASRNLDRVPQALADHPLVHAVRARLRVPGADRVPAQHLLTRG